MRLWTSLSFFVKKIVSSTNISFTACRISTSSNSVPQLQRILRSVTRTEPNVVSFRFGSVSGPGQFPVRAESGAHHEMDLSARRKQRRNWRRENEGDRALLRGRSLVDLSTHGTGEPFCEFHIQRLCRKNLRHRHPETYVWDTYSTALMRQSWRLGSSESDFFLEPGYSSDWQQFPTSLRSGQESKGFSHCIDVFASKPFISATISRISVKQADLTVITG